MDAGPEPRSSPSSTRSRELPRRRSATGRATRVSRRGAPGWRGFAGETSRRRCRSAPPDGGSRSGRRRSSLLPRGGPHATGRRRGGGGGLFGRDPGSPPDPARRSSSPDSSATTRVTTRRRARTSPAIWRPPRRAPSAADAHWMAGSIALRRSESETVDPGATGEARRHFAALLEVEPDSPRAAVAHYFLGTIAARPGGMRSGPPALRGLPADRAGARARGRGAALPGGGFRTVSGSRREFAESPRAMLVSPVRTGRDRPFRSARHGASGHPVKETAVMPTRFLALSVVAAIRRTYGKRPGGDGPGGGPAEGRRVHAGGGRRQLRTGPRCLPRGTG